MNEGEFREKVFELLGDNYRPPYINITLKFSSEDAAYDAAFGCLGDLICAYMVESEEQRGDFCPTLHLRIPNDSETLSIALAQLEAVKSHFDNVNMPSTKFDDAGNSLPPPA